MTSDTGTEMSMDQLLAEKFPDMKKVKGAPVLFTFNGFGFSLYGKRDWDDDTCTYVKTWSICALFVPIIHLAAFRVADAPKGGGWYFLGKERLSSLAKMWNAILFLVIAGLAGAALVKSHFTSPEYLMGKKLHEAQAVAVNDPEKALPLYEQVVKSNTSHRSIAISEGTALFLKLYAAADDNAKSVFLAKATKACKSPPWFLKPDKVASLGEILFLKNETARPLVALHAADALIQLGNNEYIPKKIPLLKTVVENNPDDVEHAVELALLYENEEETYGECEPLLLPLKDKLGDGEGARLLGQIFAAKEDYDNACPLLKAYCMQRLNRLHELNDEYVKAYEAVSEMAISELNNNKASPLWYRQYNRAGEAQQEKMVDEYVNNTLAQNKNLKRIQYEIANIGQVVPATLDLGMVMLRKAQGMAGEERTASLKEAEETFLSVQGVADDSPQYQIQYGQVLCWLGKMDEAQKLFDQFLDGTQRSVNSLSMLAEVLRQVGRDTDARRLSEEAYGKSQNPEEKFRIAFERSKMFTDLDDQISWLEKSDITSPYVTRFLMQCKGSKAQAEGRFEIAEKHLRAAMKTCEGMPDTTYELNNRAIIASSLFSLSGLESDCEVWLSAQKKSLALDPSDTILLSNTVYALRCKIYCDLLREDIDYSVLRCLPSGGDLRNLYADDAGRKALYARYHTHEEFPKILDYLKKGHLLAPSDMNFISSLASYYYELNDQKALKELLMDVKKAPLDIESTNIVFREIYEGKRDKKTIEDYKNSLTKCRAILKTLPENVSPATRTELIGTAYDACVALLYYGEPQPEMNTYIAEASTLHAQHPSEKTRSLMSSIAANRIHQELCAEFPAYAKQVQAAHLGSSVQGFLVYAAATNEAIRSAVKASEHFSEWVSHRVASIDAFSNAIPSKMSVDDWQFCHLFVPEHEAAILRQIKADGFEPIQSEMGMILYPLSLDAVLGAHWLAVLNGETTKAQEIVANAKKLGVPVPEWN